MNENVSGTSNLLDTTDCLDAVGVFKGWKNFFFIIIFFCILILQASFWISDLGMIEMPQEVSIEIASIPIFSSELQSPSIPDGDPIEIIISDSNQPVTELPNDEPNVPGRAIDPNDVSEGSEPFRLAAVTTISPPNDMNDMSGTEKEEAGFLSGITFDNVVWLMRFVNAILILTAILYCLTMLFSLKISMLGRLGGINHITRAFFLSLVLLVFALPWQRILGGVVIGAIFTPEEFIKWHAEKASDMFGITLYYMRFCGYMVFVFLLLLMTQLRSSRWTKAILRRLEII